MPPKRKPAPKQTTIASFFSPPKKRATEVVELLDSSDDEVVAIDAIVAKKARLDKDNNGRYNEHEREEKNSQEEPRIDTQVTESDEKLARRLAAEWEAEDRTIPSTSQVSSNNHEGDTAVKTEAGSSELTASMPTPKAKPLHPMFARQAEAGPSRTREVALGAGIKDTPKMEVKKERHTLVATRGPAAEPIDFDSDSLLFRPVHIDISRWPGGRLPYSVLVGVYVQVASTRSRLTIVRVLTNFIHLLLVCCPVDLPFALYLLSNHLRPSYLPSELGIGSMILTRAIKDVSGLGARDLKSLWAKHGDPGDVAYEAKVRMRTLVEPAPLVVADVYKRVLGLADIKGPNSGKLKGDVVRKLMVQARGEEVRYLVRTLVGNLRIGAVRLTLLTSLARAAALLGMSEEERDVLPLPEKGKKPIDPTREAAEARCAAAVALVRRVYVRHPNYGDLVRGLEGGLEGLEERVPLSVGIPISPMLGSITRSLDEVYQRLGTLPFTAETKLDGQRLQMHVRRGGPEGEDDGGRWVERGGKRAWVRLFSRHLEDMTEKYPDICALGVDLLIPTNGEGERKAFPTWASTPSSKVMELLHAEEVTSLIVDAEIVAVDRKTGARRTFQELTNRARKDVRLEDIAVVVEVNAFDVMLLNDVPLLSSPFSLRRHLMRQLLPPRPTPADPMLARWTHIDAVDSVDLNSPADLRAFFDKVVEQKAEGLMVKLLESGSGGVGDVGVTVEAGADDDEGMEAFEVDDEGPDHGKTKGRKKPLPATYEPDQRSMGWLKVKKDYLEGLGDSLDLVPVGAWWGSGRKAGWWSPILLAARNPDSGALEAVCKCMSGFTDAFYKSLLERYPPDDDPAVCSPYPLGVVDSGGLTPDRWFLPREVWEIRGADITLSPVYPAGASFIGGERGLSLRFPRFIRVREDKGVEEATSAEEFAEMYRRQMARPPVMLGQEGPRRDSGDEDREDGGGGDEVLASDM